MTPNLLNSTYSEYVAATNDVALSLTGLAAIFIDLILIYIILHFRRLNTIVYLFLVHRSIAELIRLIVNPLTFSLIYHHMHESLTDLTTEIGSLARTAVALFEIFMIVDWTMENLFPNKLGPWRNKYKIVVTVVWTPVLFGFLWIFGHYNWNSLIRIFKWSAGSVSLVCMCVTGILQIFRCFMVYVKKKTLSDNCGLSLVTLSVAMRVVALLWLFVDDKSAIFLFFEHLLLMFFILYLSIFCEDFAIYFKKFCVCDLKDDCPDNSQIYLCQGCGAYVGFEELGSEAVEENLPSENNV